MTFLDSGERVLGAGGSGAASNPERLTSGASALSGAPILAGFGRFNHWTASSALVVSWLASAAWSMRACH